MMVVFPNCKINLGLHITGKRADGFHQLETVFYPIKLIDSLEVVHLTEMDSIKKLVYNEVIFTSSGINIPGDPIHNLCLKAYQILKADFPQLPRIKMHLHKTIPMGAGLGGGSADGAFALQLLNEKFDLKINQTALIQYAAKLGSDCPFFIINKAAYATGRGEILRPIQLDLSNYQFVLVHPGIHISTKWAFEQIKIASPITSLNTVIQQPIEFWKDSLYNDFEAPILKAYPKLKQIKKALYDDGAIYASMTGSGSSFFGIYKKNELFKLKEILTYPINII